MIKKSALIIHPDIQFTNKFKQFLLELNCGVQIFHEHVMPKERIDENACDLFIVHENVELSNGKSIIEHFQDNGCEVPAIIISERGDLRRAVSAIQSGVFDYFSALSDEQIIQEGIKSALDIVSKREGQAESNQKTVKNHSIVTRSKNMDQLLSIAKRVAASNATILIQGESGTGKELLARFVHLNSARSRRQFVAMNCAALPENLAESELFGYEKGAFTGATHKKPGKFEQAHGSTLLLDEISEMPLSLQVKLLRVLQEKEIDHIGGRKPIPVDARIIATSNRDIGKMVHEGAFRKDLYYRLRVVPLTIPPLKDRKDDIPLLVDHFIEKYNTLHNQKVVEFTDAATEQLYNWNWPGNVRELENTIERAVLLCDESLIGPEHLLLELDGAQVGANDENEMVGMTVKEMEKKLIGQTLQHVNENRTHAAKMLGISIRTLRNKLREYGEP